MPYDKLVKALRHCVLQNPCDGCPFYAGMDRPTEQCASMNWLAADAIEELSKALDAVNDAHNEGYDIGYWAGRRDYEPKWIPVTEEPPLKVGDDGYNGYLVYANGYYEVADYTTDKFDNVPYFHVNGEYEPDVTHYMPLPQPPEEET